MQLIISHARGQNWSGPVVKAMKFEKDGPEFTNAADAAKELARVLFEVEENKDHPLVLSDSVGSYMIFPREYINNAMLYIIVTASDSEDVPDQKDVSAPPAPLKKDLPTGEVSIGFGKQAA